MLKAPCIERFAFWAILLLSVIDRLVLLFGFGFQYVGDDDGVIWSGAVDYGHGIFREPYFYGQDYGPMLEALVAAPFVRLGLPIHLVMPICTTLLAMLPFWSFGLWHLKHDRSLAAMAFVAVPVLLPVEYGLVTTITRGFVTGVALLFVLPIVLDNCRNGWRDVLIGATLAAAWFVNPNSVVFAVAFAVWYVLNYDGRRTTRAAMMMIAGAFPLLLAQSAAQRYCSVHPERIVLTLYDWKMDFHPEGILESMGMLEKHFAWLFPLLWPLGQLTFWAVPLLIIVFLIRGSRRVALALTFSLAVVVYSFCFAKTHDGYLNVFFPYARMYLAMPVLLAWSVAALLPSHSNRSWTVPALVILCAGSLMVKVQRFHSVLQDHLDHQVEFVFERRIDVLWSDAMYLRRVAQENHVGLIVAMDYPAMTRHSSAVICILRWQHLSHRRTRRAAKGDIGSGTALRTAWSATSC